MTKRERSEHISFHLPAIFMNSTLSNLIFAYISSKVEEGIKINDAASMFQTFVRMQEHNLPVASILMSYNRAREDFRLFNRHDWDNWTSSEFYRTKKPLEKTSSNTLQSPQIPLFR